MGENGGVWWCVGGTMVSGISRSTSWCKKVSWPENILARWPDSAAPPVEPPPDSSKREREREFLV